MEQTEVVLFWIAVLLYAAAFITYVYFFTSKKESIGRIATYIVSLGWVIHSFSILFRGLAVQHLPIASPYESVSAICWSVITAYLILEYFSQIKVVGIFVTILTSLFMGYGWTQYTLPKALRPQLRGMWVALHVSVIFIGYGAIIVAAGLAILYLLQEKQLKSRKPSNLFKRLPSLEALDEMSYRAIAIAVPFLSMGIAAGAIWMQVAWEGRPDIIIASAGTTWVLLVAYLLLRHFAGWRGRKASILAIAGFVTILLIHFVVVPYLSQFHGIRG
jgi:ABC-type transport system involved in cytochrome c biogenesis permease subunit